MLRRLKRLLYSLRHEPMALRRWEAAKTDRLNQAHWRDAHQNEHINLDLGFDLDTLRQRVAHELENNPFLEGVVNTHVADMIGEDGPALRVISQDAEFNARLQEAWQQWWAMPDLNGQFCGCELLDQAVRQLWTQGSWLWQKVTDREANTAVKLRLLEIHPRRLATPPQFAFDDRIMLGVERNRTGRPLAYHLREALPGEITAIGALSLHVTRIAAQHVIHRFRRVEVGQVDGYPWLASALQVAADLRDYDAQVLDAARAAADWMLALHTSHDDAPFLEVNESVEFQRRRIATMPPGWEPFQVKPEQPATNYVEYRTEKQRELGRAAGMPLMLVRLDSSKHNFASARFDAEPYKRQLRKLQAWIERGGLNPLVEEVRLERGLTPPAGGYRLEWTWQIPEFSGAPAQEANAESIRLRTGSSTIRRELAQRGVDPDTHAQQLQEEIADFRRRGIAHPAAGAVPAAAAPAAERGGAGGSGSEESREEALARLAELYAAAVRAGLITPNVDDERHFRQLLELPDPNDDVIAAWARQQGVRQPVTLQNPRETEPAAAETSEDGPQ